MSTPVNSIPAKVFRATDRHDGWREVFSPRRGDMACLTYARLVCGPETNEHVLNGDDREWAFFCVAGQPVISVNGRRFELTPRDLLYVPRGRHVVMAGSRGADVVAAGAPADRDAEPVLVPVAEVAKDPQRCLQIGSDELHTRRTIYSMLDTRVNCSRLLAGFTVGTPGAWTSWPPHEHNDSKEEFYLFFDMPAPAFSVQFVYPTPERMDFCPVVRQGDCVTIPSGFHPTAAAPGFSTVFFWAMAAFDPDRHRDLKYGITLQPDYQDVKFL